MCCPVLNKIELTVEKIIRIHLTSSKFHCVIFFFFLQHQGEIGIQGPPGASGPVGPKVRSVHGGGHPFYVCLLDVQLSV